MARLFLLPEPKSKLELINDMTQRDLAFADNFDDIFPSVFSPQ